MQSLSCQEKANISNRSEMDFYVVEPSTNDGFSGQYSHIQIRDPKNDEKRLADIGIIYIYIRKLC